ncbi:hypothetical protein [Geminisphaera colitermitum]|uniref:hypothetical protein n=1 Tax=Geminisphaera colitermitum TaxID=1148786 RepID=UPI00019653BF|nr:hypothetical protein [Geminisphaera colitermitum]
MIAALTFTLTFGWWLIPAALTLAVFSLWAFTGYRDYQQSGWFVGIWAVFTGMAVIAASAIIWAVYFGILLLLR